MLNVKKVREKQTGEEEEEDLEEKVFQEEGSSLEQLRPLDLRSSARMLTPTLVRMLNHNSSTFIALLILSPVYYANNIKCS